MLDWIFEGVANWIASIMTQIMDAISSIFLDTLGADLTVIEEYFPFIKTAYDVMQYTAWAILFLIAVWQIFRSFGGPLTEADNPLHVVARSSIFAILIGYAKPVFMIFLDIARVPYTALMELSMDGSDFTFSGVEGAVKTGLEGLAVTSTAVGTLLLIILLITLGWNYFKMLLETVERYIISGILCYTSPLAYAMGGSAATSQVFKSWTRLVGSQLLLLVMNVWFIRAFNSSVGRFIASGGALSAGGGGLFLWLFCAIAFLKIAQRFDSFLSAIGMSAGQTGSSMGMEMLFLARMAAGMGGQGYSSAGDVFKGAANTANDTAAGGVASAVSAKYSPNSFMRDAVTKGGKNIAAGGGLGYIGRTLGGIAANRGGILSAGSIASVAQASAKGTGKIAGSIADKSLPNYMPHLAGMQLQGTEIEAGKISTEALDSNGNPASLSMYSTEHFQTPEGAYAIVEDSGGGQWYQTALGTGAAEFYSAPHFNGTPDEAALAQATFPNIPADTMLRTIGSPSEGMLEAASPSGTSQWYNSAMFGQPEAPHSIQTTADGIDWYAINPSASIPQFDSPQQIKDFMPALETSPHTIHQSGNGMMEIHHEDGSGMRLYDQNMYQAPKGQYTSFEDINGHGWYGLKGTPSVEHRPIIENGKPALDAKGELMTERVAGIKYDATPIPFQPPKPITIHTPNEPKTKK